MNTNAFMKNYEKLGKLYGAHDLVMHDDKNAKLKN